MRTKTGLLAAASLVTLSSPALAQNPTTRTTTAGEPTTGTVPDATQQQGSASGSAGTTAAAGADRGAAGVPDIIVTAQRREERLQTVPIAITALNGQTLEQAGIRDITRLEVLTPGLTVGQSGSDSRPALRGVNTDNSRQASADAAVAFFVDGVYQSSNQQALMGFLDLARVEVQRGPQGTLYGRNSFGGNISLITNLPTHRFEGMARGEYGSFGRYRLEGVVNAPLGDTLALRVVGLREKSRGYVRNLSPTGSRAQDIDDWYGRAALRWQPNSQTDVILRGHVWHGNGHGGGAYEYKVEGISADPANPANQSLDGQIVPINPRARASDIPGLPVLGVPVPTDPYIINQDTPATRRIRDYAGSLEINQDLGFAGFKFIGSVNDFDAVRTSDGDFTQYHVRFNLQQSRNKTQTAEAQLASHAGSPFQWVGGLYYLHTSAFEYFQQYRYTFGAFTDNIRTNFGTKSYAAYGQASYSLTDTLRVTGGIRYTSDHKTTSGNDIASSVVIPFARAKFNKVTWRGAVDYKIDGNKMLYASVSNGFRSGGFNPGISIPTLLTFGPETVVAYEVGAKTRWLDNRLQLNLAAFYNKYRKLQVVGFDTATNLVYTQNVGEKTAKGVEAELQYRPIQGLEIALTASYLDAYFNNGFAIDPIFFDRNVNLAGKRAAMSPKVRLGGALSYAFELGGGVKVTPRIQSSYVSKYYLLDFNSLIERQRSFTKTDARLTLTGPGDRFTLEAFVNNIENKAVRSGGEYGGRGAFFIGYAPPRQYGVAVGVKF